MSTVAEIITAAAAAASIAGTGIVWLWNRLEKYKKEVQIQLDQCHEREHVHQDVFVFWRAAIELMFSALKEAAPDSHGFKRASELLDRASARIERMSDGQTRKK